MVPRPLRGFTYCAIRWYIRLRWETGHSVPRGAAAFGDLLLVLQDGDVLPVPLSLRRFVSDAVRHFIEHQTEHKGFINPGALAFADTLLVPPGADRADKLRRKWRRQKASQRARKKAQQPAIAA
jgi:hypothetical protein